MTTVKVSKKTARVQTRLRRLPVFIEHILRAHTKSVALAFIKTFHNGIKKNAFGLEKLKDGTIANKRRMHMAFPEVPLYGRGDDKKDRSYVNMLRLMELKNGYKVYPSKATHYSGKVKLDKLLHVHEFGAMLKGAGGTLIRIPPRPALNLAYKATIEKQIKGERSKQVKNAAMVYICSGNESQLNIIPIDMTKPYKETETRAKGR